MTFNETKQQIAADLSRLSAAEHVQSRFHVLPSGEVQAVELIAAQRIAEGEPGAILSIMAGAIDEADLWRLLALHGLVRP